MIRDFCQLHPEAKEALDRWYQLVKKTDFQSFAQLKQFFPSADLVHNFVVFNIGGNKYRLIALIKYELKRLFIRYVLTHKEYDQEKWKEDTWYGNTKS
jgi:mRNA interferase HigB